ncbi:MAG: glycosyltransferase family 2 protein [Euryarchaeota archaeon]|jgi:glycosyltransferase involved in cell wall biosynthesis|nr:glycosyltransferase family 2 protein [Euryarchaeota archaeon]
MLQGRGIGVVIPARNESKHIGQVLSTIPSFVDHVVVVDDGSEDDTEKIALSTHCSAELSIVKLDGLGVGKAIDSGHQKLLEIFADSKFVSAVMAGDGQMDPDDLEGLVTCVISGKAEYAKGDRSNHSDGLRSMPLIRRLATVLLSFFTTLAAGQTISDSQCGYTATSDEVLRSWDWEKSWSGYGYPNFWIIQLAKHGWKIAHHPVRAIYGDEISGINNISFFIKVGIMMTIEHHARNLFWLFSFKVTPHTIFAFISYFIGWIAIIPGISTDLERELVQRGVSVFIIVFFAWFCAHIFDRRAVVVKQQLRNINSISKADNAARRDFNA